MVQFPIIQEIIDDTEREAVIDVLAARFADEANGMRAELEAIKDEARMKALLKRAATCPDLETFRNALSS